ncbi:MAG: phosphodiesterase [Deltaproteobacteria bacterium ADurb.Bin135]|jgi:archaellum component FlaF (FlaF/FlaG flagellin family)|nr:MAG: phosphodiesterase [Deltaproteobacteria bacterium ADurb.Bin135]
MTFIDIVILIATILLCGWLFYKSWNYHDKKITEADETAKDIINNAEKKAQEIIKTAKATVQQEFTKLHLYDNQLKSKEESLNKRAMQIENKIQNFTKEREFIEAKNRRQNELLGTIKHIVMSDKKFRYDLKQRIRKILMENNI